MRAVPSDAGNVELILHNDETTPYPFVVDLLTSTFGFSEIQAAAFARKVGAGGQAACGSYPKEVAEALLKVASARIQDSGHLLRLSVRPLDWGDAASQGHRCALCGKGTSEVDVMHAGRGGSVCNACIPGRGRQFVICVMAQAVQICA